MYIVRQSDTGTGFECFEAESEAKEYVRESMLGDAEEIASSMFQSAGKTICAEWNDRGQILIDVRRFDSCEEADEALESLRMGLEKGGYSIFNDSSNEDNFADHNIWILCEPTRETFGFYEVVSDCSTRHSSLSILHFPKTVKSTK